MPKAKGTKLEIDFSELKELLTKLPEMVAKKKRDEQEEWSLKITRVGNGYELTGSGDSFNRAETVIEDSETDELKSHEALLFEVMEYFNFGGSRHDKERIKIIREKGDKYEGVKK